MWAISQGNPVMEIAHFERMDLNGLSSNLSIFLESRLLRGNESSSLLVHAPITLLLSYFAFYPLCFPILSIFFLIPLLPLSSLFFVVFFLSIFSHMFFLALYLPLVILYPLLAVVHYAQLRPFYTTCCDEFYCFTPQLLLAWCGCPSQTTHWSVSYPAITTTLCQSCHVPFPDKRVLFCFLDLQGIPIRIKVVYSLLLTPMACTQRFQLIFPSFGWYVIPARHFLQKSLSRNPKIDFPLLPTARPYSLLPLTHGLPYLYWLGTSRWCLSLMCAPLSCESMTCLLFMRLPLPGGLFGLCCTFYYSFLTSCGMDKLLGLHSLHLVSSFGWVLLGYGLFFLLFGPYLS